MTEAHMADLSLLGGARAATPASAVASSGQKLVGSNFDSFLKMLTTQMTNQNPMSPMSTQEFTAQLVQFSQVEQLMNMSRSVERGVTVQESTNLLQAASLAGQTVSVRSEMLEVVGGASSFDIDVPAGMSGLRASLLDASGAVLARSDLPAGTGHRTVSLSPRFPSGAPLPDGSYRIQVVGRGANGIDVPVATTSNVRVSSVERAADGVKLRTTTGSVALQDVVAIR
jgi:flagellar basal-body rod modification protein FlgD